MLVTFKLLVYDTHVQNLIAPIFKVGDLRGCNVIQHTNINSKRDQLPCLPVIYLLAPTAENFRLIADDLQKSLYDLCFIYFVEETTEQQLDQLAIEVTKTNQAHKICRVAQEHLGAFQVVNSDFFTLFNQKQNFVDLYTNRNQDEIISKMAFNLYSVFCSLGFAPILRVTKDGDPTNGKVIEKLKSLFETCSKSQKEKFSSKTRPLLVLFNRKQDIQGMLYHSWKYLCLIQDVFGIKNNQITFKENNKSEIFELDFSNTSDEVL